MTISIITPSFGQLNWLRMCVASVADQNAPEKQEASAAQKIEDGSWEIGGSSLGGECVCGANG